MQLEVVEMNQYNPLLTMSWLANTDINPLTDKEAVERYASKYCTKAEGPSATYYQLGRSVVPHVAEGGPLLSLAGRMFNRLVAERDYSAQEVCHLLLGLPLHQDSRVVVSVDCRHYTQHTRSLNLELEAQVGSVTSENQYERYLNRPVTRPMEDDEPEDPNWVDWDNLNYVDFLQYFQTKGARLA